MTAVEWLKEHLESNNGFAKDEAIMALNIIKNLKEENEIYKKANLLIAKQRDERDREIDELQNREMELEVQNEKLQKALDEILIPSRGSGKTHYVQAKFDVIANEARREFVEILKKKAFSDDECGEAYIYIQEIDETLKEMENQNNEC